ncbi:MAG: hypothetical protein AAB383_06110 [Patescibacteria group bacterium]
MNKLDPVSEKVPVSGEESPGQLIEDFNSMFRHIEIAGNLTQLMLSGSEQKEFLTAFHNAGNGAFSLEQRWAMYKLYGTIKGFYTESLESLKDLSPKALNASYNEVIRSLFKGEIPLVGMDSGGFSIEVRRLATRLMAA